MSWWKPFLKWLGQKALEVAADEAGKQISKKVQVRPK